MVDERFEIQSYFPEERNQNARVWNEERDTVKKGGILVKWKKDFSNLFARDKRFLFT